MAGHSKFKNIMHRKGAQDAKRAKKFTKLIREIITAVRAGQADVAFNPRLRLAISNARSLNLPKDKIENAIKKGSTPSIGENYDEIRYEGYMPGGIAVIIEALTDNRNRTASDVRSAFTKSGGNLGETNSVSFMFDKVGLIKYDKKIATDEQIFEAAIEANADNCDSDENNHIITCKINIFNEVRDIIIDKYGEPLSSKLSWIPKDILDLDNIEQEEKLIKLIDILEDSDDVQDIYTNSLINSEI